MQNVLFLGVFLPLWAKSKIRRLASCSHPDRECSGPRRRGRGCRGVLLRGAPPPRLSGAYGTLKCAQKGSHLTRSPSTDRFMLLIISVVRRRCGFCTRVAGSGAYEVLLRKQLVYPNFDLRHSIKCCIGRCIFKLSYVQPPTFEGFTDSCQIWDILAVFEVALP